MFIVMQDMPKKTLSHPQQFDLPSQDNTERLSHIHNIHNNSTFHPEPPH
ncbi:hypothetical protein E2C01_096796 [Portunus trituberculatus]|uniref:Uncharacterized protein n=1 Tax=Portunus trituberculatus TaxID=210409 RepID=A0A5B7K416_PORTR|nr:hypothetical protein [Portunus trituberculatus]